jgi:hypothetical protein
MSDQNALTWDEVSEDQVEDRLEEGEVEEAESMGQRPHGRFLCTCVDSVPKQKNFSTYTALVANLKWQIDEVLGLFDLKDGTLQPATEKQKDLIEGKFHYDDVCLPDPLEKDGMRKRRILIAKRIGLINSSNDKISKKAWAKDVIGKRAIITTDRQEGETKEGKKTGKFYVNVAFSGYEPAEAAAEKISEDSFKDI